MPLPLTIRADASPTIGSGHVMRMIALAQGWLAEDLGPVRLASFRLPEALRARVEAEGIRVVPVAAVAPGGDADLETTAALGAEGPLALDGYHYGLAYQRALRTQTTTLVVDDVGDRDGYDADLLLNANSYAPHGTLYADADVGTTLLGLEYALLRREFWKVPARPATSGPPRRVLIALGGGDHVNATSTILAGLARLPQRLDITVLAGAMNPHREAIDRHAAACGAEVFALRSDMPALMAAADVAITGAGSIVWETLRMGLPTLAVVIADNQLGIAEDMGGRGLLRTLEHRHQSTGADDTVTELLAETLADEAFLARVRQEGPALVDGEGPRRIARSLAAAHAARGGA